MFSLQLIVVIFFAPFQSFKKKTDAGRSIRRAFDLTPGIEIFILCTSKICPQVLKKMRYIGNTQDLAKLTDFAKIRG